MEAADTIREEEFTGQFNWDVWRKLLTFARPYRRHFLGIAVLAAGTACSDAFFTLMRKFIIDHVKDVADGKAQPALLGYGALYMTITTLFCVCIFVFIRLCGTVSTSISHDIRQRGFEHLQELSFSFYDRRPAGWLVARLTSDCDRLSRTISWGSLDVAWGVCVTVGVAGVMFWADWKLALVVLSILPVTVWVSLFFQKRILAASRAVRKQNSTITAAFGECISGVRTTKTLVREAENLREFRGPTGEMYNHSVRNAVLMATYFPIVLTLGSIGQALALWFGGSGARSGGITVGTLVLFFSYAGQLFWPILEMARVFADLQSTQASAERILGLIDTEPDVKDSPEVLAAIRANHGARGQGAAIDGMSDRIEEVQFRDVSFAYHRGRRVLEDFNLTVRAGQTVALAGPTGGGKTTIVNLLCRFYEPTAGEVLIDGLEYRRRSLKWLQSNLGIVLQQPHLFSGTVRENIRYGRLDATDEEVELAGRTVRADEFISSLEDGYDTEVGEGGGRLSTGQKQLVSFARAVLADPQIFVMDEATSSVDTETEKLIQEALSTVLEGRISFIIAHRLSTIRSADVILVVRDGRVVERGNHAELMAVKGRYFDLYTNQFAEERTSQLLAEGE